MSEFIGLILGYTCTGVVLFLLIFTLLKQNSSKTSYIVWHFISWVYIYKWYPSLDSPVSADLKLLFKGLHKSFHPISIVRLSTSASSLSSNFKSLGLSNPYFLNNVEIVLCLWGCSLLLYLMFLICTKPGPTKRSVCENLIIRSSLIFYSEFSVVCFIQISEFEISTWYGVMNSIISVAVLCCLVLMMFFLTFIVYYRLKANNEEALERISTLIEEFRRDSAKQRLYYLSFMIERLLTAGALAMLCKYPAIQTFIIIFVLFCKIVFILLTMPFVQVSLNYFVAGMDFFSICSVALIIGCNAGLSDFNKTVIAWIDFSFIACGLLACVVLVFKASLSKQGTKTVNNEEILNHTNIESSVDLKHVNTKHEIRESNRKDAKVDPGRRSIKEIKNDEFRNQDSAIEVLERRETRHDSVTRQKKTKVQDLDPDDNRREETFQDTNSRIPYYGPLFHKYLSRGHPK